MNKVVETVYGPGKKFFEEKKDPLIDLELTDSTELWLIQWPIDQAPDINGQQISLRLESDGHMGAFESSSGRSYEVFSMKSQGPQETVFLNSASKAKIAGKISRHVSLVNYPEPSEFPEPNSLNLSQSPWSSMSSRREATPTRTSKPRNSQAMNPSCRTKSRVFGLGDPSRDSKRKRVDDEARTAGHSAQVSGKTLTVVNCTRFMERTHKMQSKKEKEN